jgi:quercetin dioxygenase-like cupin family protein
MKCLKLSYLINLINMQRKHFLTAAAIVATFPARLFAQLKTTTAFLLKPFKAAAGEGRKHGHLQLKGVNRNVLDVKISGSDTDGGIAIFEQTSLSQGKGTPLHVHPMQDEIFYVLEGSYRFKVGEELFDLTVGETIFLPRQIPHAWTQVSPKGKMIVTLQPAGKLEDFFVSMAALDHEPTKPEIAALFEANGMKVVGGPLEI